MSDSIMSTIRTLQEQAAQLQARVIEAEATAQHLFDDNTRLRNAIERLAKEFGEQAVGPILKNHRLGDLWSKMTPQAQAEADLGSYGCKKCGLPELDHMQWALAHLYVKGDEVLDYVASAQIRLDGGEHLHDFRTADRSGVIEDTTECHVDGCTLNYVSARLKQQGLGR